MWWKAMEETVLILQYEQNSNIKTGSLLATMFIHII